MGHDIRHPAVYDMPLGTFSPLHDVQDLHGAFDLVFYVLQVFFEVQVAINPDT